jgi:integrase
MIDAMVHGHRVRKCFSDYAAATNWTTAKRQELDAKGTDVLNFTDRLRADALEADRLLEGTGATILDCVRDWLRRHPATGGELLAVSCEKYLAAMRKGGRRPLAIYDKELKFKALCEAMGTVPTGAITDNELADWAENRGGSKVTQAAYLTVARAVVNFHRRGDKLKTVGKADETAPATMNAKTVQKILAAAEVHAPDIAAGLAVLFFAGLRPYEMQRLQWAAIDIEEKVIRLTGSDTKTRTMRHVDISQNLLAWLVRYRKAEGPLVKSQSRFRAQREFVMEKAGVTTWPVDIARHTFATMHYNAHQNAAATMAQLGHFGSPGVFVKHYKGVPVTPAEAAAYFEIEPMRKQPAILFEAAG